MQTMPQPPTDNHYGSADLFVFIPHLTLASWMACCKCTVLANGLLSVDDQCVRLRPRNMIFSCAIMESSRCRYYHPHGAPVGLA